MRRIVQVAIPEPIRDAVIVALAVACAAARALPLVQFPTVIHEGKGPVFFHYPLLGLAVAALVGWRRPFRSLLLFGVVHLGVVLALEWRVGLYSIVLGSAITPHAYLVIGNLYIAAILSALSVVVLLLLLGRRVALPMLPDWAIAAGLFGLSFVVRWWWGRHVLVSSNYLIASDDGLTYHAMALDIVSGILPSVATHYAFGGELYWYFLAGVYQIAGVGNFLAVITVQAALGALVPVAAFVIARTISGSQPVAAVTGLLCALNKILIFLSGVMGMEAVYLPLFYVGLAWLHSRPRRPWAWVGIGLTLGLANMARNEIFAYPFLLLFLAVVLVRTDRSLVRGLVFVCLGYLLASAGHMGLTYLGYGQFILPSGQAAISFSLDWYGVRENRMLFEMGFRPFEDVSKALAMWAAHPGTVTNLLALGFVKRLGLFLFMPGDGLFDPLTITDSDYIHNAFPAIRVSFPALIDSYALLFCVTGLAGLRRFCRSSALVLCTLVVYIAGLNALIIAKNPRHRAILIPIFVLGAAQGVSWLLRRVRQENEAGYRAS